MTEDKKRSLVKAITWRVIVVINSFIIMLMFVRDVKKSIAYALVLNGIALMLYYIHERIWNGIAWGRT